MYNPYTEFTQTCTCYDMMPDSIKMVVLDRRLPVKKAFFALVQNGEYVHDINFWEIFAVSSLQVYYLYIYNH